MRHLNIILSAFIATLLTLSSCVKETARGDYFTVDFQLNNSVFYDGDEISFTIRTNRKNLKIVDFIFPIAPNFLTVNSTYQVQDGLWIPKAKVSVPTSQRGRLSIVFQDPTTGAQKEFSAIYTAYASSKVNLIIENEALGINNGWGNRDRYPTIVNGDDFTFTITSKAEKLILKDIRCEFNDGSLRVGDALVFADGSYTHSFKKVLTDDNKNAKTLSLTLNNPETSRDTTILAKYVTMSDFQPKVWLENSVLKPGESASIKVSANHQRFTVAYTAPEWFVIANMSSYSATTVDLGFEDTRTFITENLNITTTGSGELKFEFIDSEVTGRSVIRTVKYTIANNIDPKDISVKYNGSAYPTNGVTINSDEVIRLDISTATVNSNNLFHAKMTSTGNAGKCLFYAPVSSTEYSSSSIFTTETDIKKGILYIKGGPAGGEYTVRIHAKNDESVYSDVKVILRQNVAFIVDADFENKVSNFNWGDVTETDNKYRNTGWYGVPVSMTGYFVNIDDVSKLKSASQGSNEALLSYVGTLNRVPIQNYTVTSSIDINDVKYCRYFCGSYNDYLSNGKMCNDATTSDGMIKYAQYPSSLLKTYTDSNVAPTGELTFASVFTELKNMNCFVKTAQWSFWGGDNCYYNWMFPEKEGVSNRWTRLNFRISNFNGIQQSYNVRYIIYLYKAKYPVKWKFAEYKNTTQGVGCFASDPDSVKSPVAAIIESTSSEIGIYVQDTSGKYVESTQKYARLDKHPETKLYWWSTIDQVPMMEEFSGQNAY